MPFDYTGSFSGSFTGELTSTNGVISSSAQVSYTQIKNKPTTISAFQANSILANTNFRQSTYTNFSSSVAEQIVDATQTLGLVGTTLSITNGNSVSLANLGAAAGGSSIWSSGSQDPETYTYLESTNNLQLTGSFYVSGGVSGSSLWLDGIGDVSASIAEAIAASVGSVFPYVGDAQITGSLKLTDVLKVGDFSSTTLPIVEAGMIAYSASNFYFGIG